ncbi:hypothetical protein J4558_20240 [Leptolyngbya sp. 15MV]|nr:hypothetical protein J4558_20240 [Leptolyngbya sp. 15MV]
MDQFGIGQPVRRKEDVRFLTGAGRYTDDVDLPGQAHCAILRSPHAHARIAALNTQAALTAPGVVAVLTGQDAVADGLGLFPVLVEVPPAPGTRGPSGSPSCRGRTAGPRPGAIASATRRWRSPSRTRAAGPS